MKTKMVKMVKMKIMKVVMMNLSSCSGLMQTRGETEKKNRFGQVGCMVPIIDHQKNHQIRVKLTRDRIHCIILGFKPPRIGFVLTHPIGLMAGRSSSPTI